LHKQGVQLFLPDNTSDRVVEESARDQINSIAVIGGGSWATALAKMLSGNKVTVHWYVRNQADVDHINQYKSNRRYLSAAKLDTEYVKPTTDLQEVLEKGSEYIVMAVPSAFIADALEGFTPTDFEGKKVVSAIKGIVPEENMLISEYLEQFFMVDPEQMCFVGGPCHAEEVALERRSFLTVAADRTELAEDFAQYIGSHYISTTTSDDVYGVEYCAVMKNIIAIASGIAHGLSYGDNFQSVLVCNAMQEIERFLEQVYPVNRNLSHSAYLGDLLVTAYSQFSRNRTFGNMLGRGYSVKAAQMEMEMVAEGYYACKGIKHITRNYDLEMPVIDAVYNIIYERISPIVEFKILEQKMT
jgi:glycerol-3-phosphate dehydrogenase (NAD(P)+)